MVFLCGHINDHNRNELFKNMLKHPFTSNDRLKLAYSNNTKIQELMQCNKNFTHQILTNDTHKLILFNKYEEQNHDFNGEFNEAEIDLWIKSLTENYVEELDSDSLISTINNKKPAAIFFFNSEQTPNHVRNIELFTNFYNLAKVFKV